MGKHSSPKPGFAKQLIRDLAPAAKRSTGRPPAEAPSTATSVLATVKQRPVVAAIAVPAAATAAVVGSSVVMGPPQTGEVTTEAASTSQQQEAPASTGVSQEEIDAQREKAGKEDIEEVKKDPKYKNKTSSKTTLNVKTPKPKPTQESSAQASKSASGSKGEEESESKGGGSTPSGVETPPCKVSSSVESGLLPNAVNGYRAVCAKFPEVKTFGGRRPGTGSDHNTGEAVDIMIAGSTGDRISEYLIKNAKALNVKYVIFEKRIWMPGRGWKSMEDRGSATQNHMDHVHASFN